MDIETGGAETLVKVSFGPFHSHAPTNFVSRFKVSASNPNALPASRAAGLPAIGDDIRGHGCPEFTITLVHILNGTFPVVAAGQVEINIRPFATFRSRNRSKRQPMSTGSIAVMSERNSNTRYWRPNHGPVPECPLYDKTPRCSKRSENSRPVRVADQLQFPIGLLLRLFKQLWFPLRPIAPAQAFRDTFFEKRLHRVAFGNGIIGESDTPNHTSCKKARAESLCVLAMASGRSRNNSSISPAERK